jgi:serine/threonine protein kinase/Tol biopolymer transport system component
MPLSVGEKLGTYEILAPIGKGGMGEVYRARDTKLKRDVALKVLPDAFVGNADRMGRFQREAEVLASLNHPNIAHIYAVEERALVMELVEGDSPKGPMPVNDAWKIAMQIADALEYAHERGIIHRDLKPTNVKVTAEGVVKLLDFGLAKAYSGQEPESEAEARATDSPTLTIGATVAGVILGTPAYMAPEQARGRKVDKRADIWSFGVVLWEMLTGQRLFRGETTADVLGKVLNQPIKFDRTPEPIRRLLVRCLERNPRDRLRDIGEARFMLAEGQRLHPVPPSATRLPWTAVAVLSIALGLVSFVHFRREAPEMGVVRSIIPPPEKTTFSFTLNRGPLALSPDGRRMVFAATGEDGKSQLWIRPLDLAVAQPLLGTDSGWFPFWSPDSRWVAFFAEGKLKKIDTQGGQPVTLADAPNARGGSWSANGVIVFAPNSSGPLQKISAAGGETTPATIVDEATGINHRFPWFLPDGTHFLYEAEKRSGSGRRMNLPVGSLDSLASKIVGEADSNAAYSEGRLVYLQQSTLMAQAFDVKTLRSVGKAVPVVERVAHMLEPGWVGVFSVSAAGLLAYQTTRFAGELQLTWFDRKGKELGTIGEPRSFSGIELSPDRSTLVGSSTDVTGNMDLWTYDLTRAMPIRFTFDQAADRNAVWSPDGRTIIFSSARKGHDDLYRKSASGVGEEELLYADEHGKRPVSLSRDGKFLLYFSGRPLDLFVLPLSPETPGAPLKPVPFLQDKFNKPFGQFSPDGRWVVYDSNESQRYEIYVAPFARPSEKHQISSSGGTRPRWRPDGKEIFYLTQYGQLIAAEVRITAERVEVGSVQMLFGGLPVTNGYLYDVSADGQRILAAVPPETRRGPEPITLMQNWAAGLKK